ncbi:MAG: hypothetical protein QNJ46_23585 [Leptolyngbyaceae cyanobacterium MO_188.B28]|nr:hypothetical protein [Leptolyngbyaceae cyanobacterium MO_188.B28]
MVKLDKALRRGHLWGSCLMLFAAGCGAQPNVPPRAIQLHQKWALQPGAEVAGLRISGGLGDISIELKGKSVRAPFNGKVQPNREDCVVFSSSEVPAYLFRLCGLKRPQLGDLQEGEVIGSGEALQFAALRRQPDGSWAIVEPAVDLLERTVRQE